MADFDSSLPVRTEDAGDVISKICDSTVTSQQLKVNADGSINVTDNSGSLTVDGVDFDIRDLVFATDKVDVSGSTVALDAPTLAALESITVQNGAGAAAVNIQDGGNSITVDGINFDIRDLVFATDKVDVTGSVVDISASSLSALENITVSATDLDIRDLSHTQDSIKVGDGTDFLAVNTDGSINVVISNDVMGSEVCVYNTSAALAGGASVNFDYTVTASTTLMIHQAFCSGSGKIKAEVKVETAVASGTYNTKFVGFNSTANPNIDIDIERYLKQVAGAKVRITITNRDNQAQDVYSTLTGSES